MTLLLYADSSSMVKLFIREEGSEEISAAVGRTDILVASRLTYAEVRAALAAALRDHRISADDLPELKSRFHQTWQQCTKVSVTNGIVSSAGDLAEKHSLSGADAIQLAAAMIVRNETFDFIEFAVSDQRLRSAAIAEGFTVV